VAYYCYNLAVYIAFGISSTARKAWGSSSSFGSSADSGSSAGSTSAAIVGTSRQPSSVRLMSY